jgi:hypothetical protein
MVGECGPLLLKFAQIFLTERRDTYLMIVITAADMFAYCARLAHSSYIRLFGGQTEICQTADRYTLATGA